VKTLALLFLISLGLNAQSDWERWEAKEPDFKIKSPYYSTRLYDNSNSGMEILTAVRNGYAFLISDHDGDNCPFYPSCSRFFVLSVKETNFLQGLLMFADRFTRDTNIFKNFNKYPKHKSGKLYDPVFLYTLDAENLEKTYLNFLNAE
jgi:putative component of membrane protein insertase Oxa1/YidC/SpoIIIJ protein YidD